MIRHSTERLMQAAHRLDSFICNHITRRREIKDHINRIKNYVAAKGYKGRKRMKTDQLITDYEKQRSFHEYLAQKATRYIREIDKELKRRKSSRYRRIG